MLQGIENECLQMEDTISKLASECQEMQDKIEWATNRLYNLKYSLDFSKAPEVDEKIAIYEQIEKIIAILELKGDADK